MTSYCVPTDYKFVGDLLIALAGSDEAEDLNLPRRQAIQVVWLSTLPIKIRVENFVEKLQHDSEPRRASLSADPWGLSLEHRHEGVRNGGG